MKRKTRKYTYYFRPVEYNYRIKECYKHCPKGPHFSTRDNSPFKIRVFQIVHHYANHAPSVVSKGWKAASKRQAIRFGYRGSWRFLNKYTAHSYM